MAQVNAKCTNCGKNVLIDDNRDASICPNCKEAFVTDRAITLYNRENQITEKPKKRHVWKSLGRGLLMALECIGYLFYVLFFIWLFVDITNDIKKK